MASGSGHMTLEALMIVGKGKEKERKGKGKGKERERKGKAKERKRKGTEKERKGKGNWTDTTQKDKRQKAKYHNDQSL